MKRWLVTIWLVCTILSSCDMMYMDQLKDVEVYSLNTSERQEIDNVFGDGYSDSCTVMVCSFSKNEKVSYITNGALGTYVEENDTIYINGDYYSGDYKSVLFFEYGIRYCVKELGRERSGAKNGLCTNDVPTPEIVQQSIVNNSHYDASVEANIISFYYTGLAPRGCYFTTDQEVYVVYMKDIMGLPIAAE